jgi:hypothetical protein
VYALACELFDRSAVHPLTVRLDEQLFAWLRRTRNSGCA